MIARNFYVPIMCFAGVVIGGYARAHPDFANGSIPPYVWLLGVSLAFDLAVMALATRIGVIPLTMNTRMFGFFSGVVLYMLIVYVFGGAAAT
ncbi:MAG: hypothetical protein H6872_04370 [Methylobacteriaceae bacterium]|nr:hypothetical protein [Methylobacteriaceae bacterium]